MRSSSPSRPRGHPGRMGKQDRLPPHVRRSKPRESPSSLFSLSLPPHSSLLPPLSMFLHPHSSLLTPHSSLLPSPSYLLLPPYSLGFFLSSPLGFRGGLVFKAHRLLYHSTLGSRVIKKKKKSSYFLFMTLKSRTVYLHIFAARNRVSLARVLLLLLYSRYRS